MLSIIKKEIGNFLISELEKNLFCDINKLKYGNYSFHIAKNDLDNYLLKNEAKIEIKGLFPGQLFSSYIYMQYIKKHKISYNPFPFRKKLTWEQEIENKLFDLFTNLCEEEKRLKEIEKGKAYIQMLPEEKRNQIIREQKLERILDEKSK